MPEYDLHERAAEIVRDAGGELVGRTRLQKVTYLSQLAGFHVGFPFEYRHYGPYSEELSDAIEIAVGCLLVEEDERPTDWGGWYSIYRSDLDPRATATERSNFLRTAKGIGAVELELAATAAFLFEVEGFGRLNSEDPWIETARRKPEKAANGGLNRAKRAYRRLQGLRTPSPLPELA